GPEPAIFLEEEKAPASCRGFFCCSRRKKILGVDSTLVPWYYMSEGRTGEATPMTKRDIMIRAHEIARTLEGDYMARMSMALRQAWLEARLIQAGGRRWEKGGHNRIYFNNLAELYGLRYDTYNT